MTTRIITFDGPAASGKGFLANTLATELDYAHLDSGLIFRTYAKLAVDHGINPDDTDAVIAYTNSFNFDTMFDKLTDNASIRTEPVGLAAAKIGALPVVRQRVLQFQHHLGENPPDGKHGLVIDGRTTGVEVFPHAPLKFFVTATREVRAYRRWLCTVHLDPRPTMSDVFVALTERDHLDETRVVSKLRPASDAIGIDTTDMTKEDAYQIVLGHYQRVFGL